MIFNEFVTKKGKSIQIVEYSMDRLTQLLNFYRGLTEEDAMINRYDKINEKIERIRLSRKIKEISSKNAIAYLALSDGKIVGLVNISRVGGRSWHVGTLTVMVDKKFRNEGLGYYLINICLEKAKKIDINKVVLECFINNEPAIKLYKKIGFKEFGRLPEALLWRGEFYDELSMYKDI